MSLETIQVLFIEDDAGYARLIRDMLYEATAPRWELPQFALTWVNTLAAALAYLDAGGVDVVLSDLDLPDSQAGDTFARLHAHVSGSPIVVLTGRADEALARDTVRAGAADYLFKRELRGSLLAHALLYAIERQRNMVGLQAARTAELEQANADLEQFAFIISHDLREPLRAVTSYLQLLQKRYAGQLDEKADKFIAYAVGGAGRMHELINGLLAYSRVGTRAEPFVPIDCGPVLDDALADLRVFIEERRAVVTRDPLPTVVADAVQLGQVFRNLIDNAIKFCREEPPRVHISARRESDVWVFAVHDNGIGIDPTQTKRIFDVFQRLHTLEEYPGAGIGLPICKRIVERHGGRIWVQSSAPDQGSTFCFTIPLQEETGR